MMRKASKKTLATVLLALACVMSFGLTGIALAADDVSYVNPDSPALGSQDAAAIFEPAPWSAPSFGTKRRDFGTTEIVISPDWGTRGTFKKAVDLTDFSFSLNLSKMKPSTCVGMQISASDNGFPTATVGINIEVIRSATEEHGYGVTIGDTKGGHNMPYNETNVDALWDMFYGIPFIGENQLTDDTVDIRIQNQGENFVFTVEGADYTVPAATVNVDNCLGDDLTACKMSFFAFNNVGIPQSFTFTNFRDPAIDAYLAEGGDYEVVTGQIDAYVALADGDLATIDQLFAAMVAKSNIETAKLFSYDLALHAERIAAADAKVEQATAAIPGARLAIATMNTESYTEALADPAAVNTVDALIAALGLKATAEDAIAIAEADENATDEDRAALEALKATKAAADIVLQGAIDEVMTDLVGAYTQQADDLAGLAKLLAAKDAKAAINANIYAMVTEAVKATLDEAIAAADAKVAATQTLTGWTLGGDALIAVQDNKIDYASMGGWSGNALVYGEKFDATNFKMQVKFDQLGAYNTSWFSFGLMEKAEPFNNNDNETVQDNKGLFFFVIPLSSTKAKIEVYQISLMTNRFFDALKTETLEVDLTAGGTLDFDLSTFTKELAGKTEEYLKVTIGGKTMQTDLIKTSALKTSLGTDNKGYLVLCSTGSGSYPWQVTVNSINDKAPTAADITTPVDRSEEPAPGPDESEQPTDTPSGETPAGCGCGTIGPMSAGGIGGMIGGILVLAAAVLAVFVVKKACLKRKKN